MMEQMLTQLVALPAGVAIFITLVVGIAKYAGLPDGKGGLLALGLSTLTVLGLTVAIDGFGVDIESEKYKAIFDLIGFAGQAGLTFLGAFLSHKVSKEAQLGPSTRRNGG
jgi:hypothetical protein